MLDIATEVLVIAVLVSISFMVTAYELALFSSNRLRLLSMRESGVRGSGTALRLLKTYRSTVNTIILINILANTGVSVLLTEIMISVYGEDLGSLMALVVGTIIIVFFGESIPKILGLEYRERLAVRLSPLMYIVVKIFRPAADLLAELSSRIVSRLARGLEVSERDFLSEKEIRIMLRLAQKRGVISRAERRLIENIMRFMDKKAEDVMIPRRDLVMVSIDDPVERVYDLLEKCGHSRYPVYEGNENNIVGMIHVKDLLIRGRKGPVALRDILRPIIRVYNDTSLIDVFREMKRSRIHMAAVFDYNNNLLGAVTLEDLLEEVFGEIYDEYDLVTRSPGAHKR